jgi:hypothetical protein
MFTIAIVLVVLASLVALANLIGCYQATQRARKGLSGGYSTVPILSLVFSLVAWRLAIDTMGYWAFVPAALDPGTWALVFLPFYLLWRIVNRWH